MNEIFKGQKLSLTWRWGPGPDGDLYCPGPCGPGGPLSPWGHMGPYIGDGRPYEGGP